MSFTTELLIPSVAVDFNKEVNFLKLPRIAIPAVPRKTEIIFEITKPVIKLTITEMEFSDKRCISLFCLKIFNL